MAEKLVNGLLFLLVILIIIAIVITLYWVNGSEKPIVSEKEAFQIALGTDACNGVNKTVFEEGYYNPNSKTWWFNIEIRDQTSKNKEYCDPACVVYGEKKYAQINWRCTGLIPEYT